MSVVESSRELLNRQADACEWSLLAGEGERLFPEGATSAAQLLARFPHTVLKSGSHRIVYRLETDGGVCYLKHYKISDWKSRLQNWVRPSRARIEWNHTWQLIDLGFDSCLPIALGEVRSGAVVRDSFFITREISGAIQLDHFIEQVLPESHDITARALCFELANQLGHLTAELHLKGVQHRDYHAGNVLVTYDKERLSLRLWLIDLHQVTFGKRLTVRQSLSNFALLNSYFSNRGDASDRRRFFRAYWNTIRQSDRKTVRGFTDYKESIRLIEAHCEREMWKEFARADVKWDRGNRRLIILEGKPGEAACRGVSELGKDYLQKVRKSPETILGSNRQAEPIELPSRDGLLQGYLKSSDFTTSGGFSARAAWNIGHACIRRRLSTPRPLLFAEKGDRNWLVTKTIPNAVTLPELARISSAEPLSFRTRRQLTRRTAAQLAWRDRCGFIDRRPRLDNILVDANRETIYFVGLGYVTSGLPPVEEANALSTLAAWAKDALRSPGITRSDRLRFLKRYLHGKSVDWKRYWKRIDSEVHSTTAD